MNDDAYRPARWSLIVAVTILLGFVLGGMFVAITVDREMAAARWEWTED